MSLDSAAVRPLLPYEPRVVDRDRQAALTEQFLLPALSELYSFFLAVRRQVDGVLEVAQPVKLGKAYPLGQCLEISATVMRALERIDQSPPAPAGTAAATGQAAFAAFLKAGGAFRQVWGDLRGEYFQNAFQLGTLYLDVSNDTVTSTKPKVEILPFDQSRLAPIADFRHFSNLARRYWRHAVFPNHALPELAPFCPLIHLDADGRVSVRECSAYMVGLTMAGRFMPSEDVLADAPMPEGLFRHVIQSVAGGGKSPPDSPEQGRTMALQACRAYREKGWHDAPHHAIEINKAIHEANRRFQDASLNYFGDHQPLTTPGA